MFLGAFRTVQVLEQFGHGHDWWNHRTSQHDHRCHRLRQGGGGGDDLEYLVGVGSEFPSQVFWVVKMGGESSGWSR